MFSYVDLVRAEIAMDAEERFAVTIPDEDRDGWRTLSDVVQSVVRHASGTAAERDVFNWVRTLMVEAYKVTMELTRESDVFSDYDRATAWFFARE